MKLVGQYDSPFVRRVAVTLHHHGVAFERIVISVFQDFDDMLTINPLGKVPVLILPDGRHLIDSKAIIEYLEGQAGPDKRLTLSEPDDFVAMLQLEAAGIGLAEKTYERGIEYARKAPGKQDADWIARLERQIGSVLAWLNDRMSAEFLVAGRLSRADLAVAIGLTFLSEKQPQLYPRDTFPALEAFRSRIEALPPFQAAAYSASEAASTGWKPEQH